MAGSHAAQPHQRCVPPSAEISEFRSHLGRHAHASVLRPRPVALLLRRNLRGIHESVPIYSGGLGVLAGDHIKSASDLDIPLIGIGLFYGHGYFRQRIDSSGMAARKTTCPTDTAALPMELAIGKNGARAG